MLKRNRLAALALVSIVAVIAVALVRAPWTSPSQPSAIKELGSATLPFDASPGREQRSADDSRSGGEKAREWLAEQQRASDLYSFVRQSAQSAYEGDAEAQLAIARSLYTCESASGVTTAARAEPARTHQPPPGYAEQAGRCKGWEQNDLFLELPQNGEPYDFDYWLERSASAGQPAAAAWRASLNVAGALNSQAELEEISASLKRSVRTRDPAALFYTGMALMTAPLSDADLRGYAFMALACRRSACEAVPEMLLSDPCKSPAGAVCDSWEMRRYEGQIALGAEQFAAVSALSYRIEERIERGAWQELDLSMKAQSPPETATN